MGNNAICYFFRQQYAPLSLPWNFGVPFRAKETDDQKQENGEEEKKSIPNSNQTFPLVAKSPKKLAWGWLQYILERDTEGGLFISPEFYLAMMAEIRDPCVMMALLFVKKPNYMRVIEEDLSHIQKTAIEIAKLYQSKRLSGNLGGDFDMIPGNTTLQLQLECVHFIRLVNRNYTFTGQRWDARLDLKPFLDGCELDAEIASSPLWPKLRRNLTRASLLQSDAEATQ